MEMPVRFKKKKQQILSIATCNYNGTAEIFIPMDFTNWALNLKFDLPFE